MQGTGKWLAGGLVAILGLVGLFVAANARDTGMHLFGLIICGFAVVYVFGRIKLSFDEAERRPTGGAALSTRD